MAIRAPGLPMIDRALPRESWWALAVPAVAGIALWAWSAGPLAMLAETMVLGCALLALAACDAAVWRLPDGLTLPLLASGLATAWWHDADLVGHLAGAALGFAAGAPVTLGYRLMARRSPIGGGDAKLAAAGGAWLGWQAVPPMLLLAAMGALIWYGALAAVRGGRALQAPMPFGIPLAAAIWIGWLFYAR